MKWADSVGGLRAVRRDFIVGPLSNGNTALLVDMAKAADLPWDVILGSDVSRAYKPSPQAYLGPATLLGLAPGEVMLVAAHNADLAAAREAGLATGYVPRPAEYGPHQPRNLAPTGDWDVLAESIIDLAERRKDEDRRLHRLRPQIGDDRQAVALGQHAVDDQHVVLSIECQRQAFLAVAGLIGDMADLTERLDQIFGRVAIVLDNQKAHLTRPRST